MNELERNKKAAIAFYDLMFNQCQPRQAIERYAGAVYIQHNPRVADGKDAFIAYFEKMAKEYRGKRVHFKRAFAERRSTSSCTAIRNGQDTRTRIGQASTSSVSTRTGRSSSTGACFRWCRQRRQTATRCSSRLRRA